MRDEISGILNRYRPRAIAELVELNACARDEAEKLSTQFFLDNLVYGRSVARVGETDGKPWIERLRPHSADWAAALVEIDTRRGGLLIIDEMGTIPDEAFERFAGEHLAESEPPPALHTSANEDPR